MFQYNYKLTTEGNQIISGSITSYSRFLAERKLSNEGNTVILIIREKFWFKNFNIAFGFSRMEKILFFRNMAMMVDAGLVLSSALDVLKNQVKGSGIKKAILKAKENVLNGQTLSSSFEEYPKFFSKYIVD